MKPAAKRTRIAAVAREFFAPNAPRSFPARVLREFKRVLNAIGAHGSGRAALSSPEGGAR